MQTKQLLIPISVQTLLSAACITAVAYVAFIWHLGTEPLRQWDEATLAVNAFETLHTGQLFAKYMGNELDYVNTKPPLATWLIALTMQAYGPSEHSLRLPSAVAARINKCLAILRRH